MAHEAYFSVTGQKQGAFKGESTRNTGGLNWIEVEAFEYGVNVPYDAASGQPNGRRQHGSVNVVKAWGAASPQFFTSLATNEILTQVVFQFARTNPSGAEYVYQTITLTNATVSRVERFTGGPGTNNTPASSSRGEADTLELERVSFIFKQIAIEDTDGQTRFTDDWSATV
jgi:type VI secretion system secreted protein Hcp